MLCWTWDLKDKLLFTVPLLMLELISTVVSEKQKLWLTSEISVTEGHYPGKFCRITNVVMSTSDKKIYYKNTESEFQYKLEEVCNWNHIMWSLSMTSNNSSQCDKVFSSGYFFPIYYHYGSNYYHLHYDTLMPLYYYLYYTKKNHKNTAILPGVETRRLDVIDWETDAFDDKEKYWMHVLSVLADASEGITLIPVNKELVYSFQNICFKTAYFGTPEIRRSEDFMNSFIHFIKRHFNIPHERLSTNKVGLIKRSNRRRVVNEDNLITRIRNFTDADLVQFENMSFREQVAKVQQYTVLIGMNGAGLMNALYLPPGAVAVQLVPYKAMLCVDTFAELLRTRGPYLEWKNTYEHMSVSKFKGDNSQADTIVHEEEFVSLVKEALNLVNTDKHTDKSEL